MRFGRTGSSSPALCVVLLVIGHAALAPRGGALLVAAAAMTALSWRVSPRLLAALATVVLLLDAAESVHARLRFAHEGDWNRAWVARRADDLQKRERALAEALASSVQEIAALPETRAALTNGPAARSPLFAALIARERGKYQGRFPQPVALAIENDRQETVA